MTFDSSIADEPYCYVTTTGRVTGNPHEIEIWFGLNNGILYILSGGRDKSDWVRNLIKQPNVTIRIAGTTHNATARIVEPGTPEDAMARQLLVEKYRKSEDDLASWGRTALPVAFETLT
jgi:deazaflavin-dependent oxidoreductase (nitroreductase family)